MPVCQVCQHDNPQGAEFCEECGASLAASTAPVGARSGAPSAQSTSTPGETAPSAPLTPAAPVNPNPTPVPGEAAPAMPPPASMDTPSTAAGPVSGAETPDPAGATPTPETTPPVVSPPPSGDAAPPPGEVQSPTAARTRLVAIRHGAPTGEEIPLLGDRLVIGRFDPETGPVDIDLSSTPEAVHVSRQHAELYRGANGQWMVRDLGSTNGVFAKSSSDAAFGPRITAPRSLENGDEVTFGNARFRFRTD